MSRFSYYLEMLNRLSVRSTPKVLNYAKYRCSPRKSVVSVKQYSPQIGSLFLTTRCNLNCGYCNLAKIRQEGKIDWHKSEASLEKIKRIMENPLFSNCLFLDLYGGEPLLVEELGAIISYLSEQGYITNVTTNGLLLDNRIAELKSSGVSRINVSLYDENYSSMQTTFEKVNRVFPVHASIVISRRMLEKDSDNLLNMVRMAHKTGCLSLRFWMYRPMGLNPQTEDIISDTNAVYTEFQNKVENMVPGFCLWPVAIQTARIKKLCPQLWQRVGCDMTGNIIVCCGMDETLKGPNGNLFDNKPDVVFNHPTLVNMREKLVDPKSPPPDVCKTCNLLGDPGW